MSTRSAQKTAASTRPRREAKPVQVVNIAAPDSPKRKKSSSKAGADTDANGKGKAAKDAAAAAKASPAAKAKAGTPKVKSSEAAASAKAAQRLVDMSSQGGSIANALHTPYSLSCAVRTLLRSIIQIGSGRAIHLRQWTMYTHRSKQR
jgi:hypothetical protein